MENGTKTDRRALLGGILIVFGALLLLSSINVFNYDISDVIFSWPFFFTLIGLYVLLNTEKKLLGGILSGIGLLFLLPRIFPQIEYDGSIIFPIILIAIGIYIIFNHRNKFIDRAREDGSLKKDILDDVAIFGGGSKIVTSDNFKGGNVTAIFGGSEINLSGCKLAEGEHVLDVLCVFGGTTLIIPKDWNVVVNVTSILGGFSDKSIRDPNLIPDQTRTLYIKGLAFFGGGEVKNYF